MNKQNEMEEDKFPDEIFKRGHHTTMEQLLFAKKYIEELKKEVSKLNYTIGVLESEKSEVNDIVNGYISDSKNKEIIKENERLKKENKALQKQNQEFLNGYKKEDYIKNLLDSNRSSIKQISKLRGESAQLIMELVKLKNPQNPKT